MTGRPAVRSADFNRIAPSVFTNVFNRINDTEIDFPAVAGS